MFSKLKLDFAPEWAALLALLALVLTGAWTIGFHLRMTWSDGGQIGGGLACMLLLRAFWERGGMMAEYFSLTALTTLIMGILSYLCLASSGPLVDSFLAASDRALHFDWMAGYQFLLARPLLATILKFAYNSMVVQGLYFCVLFSLMGQKQNLREMFWLVLLASLFTCLGVLLFPALGPFKLFAAGPSDSFVPVMEHVRSRHGLNFALAELTGVVSFPSFHTAMALAFVWGFRNTGPIGWCAVALNFLMLCAIPWYGGHYLTDMIAGGAVMVISLAIVRMARRQPFLAAAEPLPVATATR